MVDTVKQALQTALLIDTIQFHQRFTRPLGERQCRVRCDCQMNHIRDEAGLPTPVWSSAITKRELRSGFASAAKSESQATVPRGVRSCEKIKTATETQRHRE